MALISLTSGPVVPLTQVPLAQAIADPAYGVLGSVVRLDGQQSSDPGAQPSRAGLDGVTSGSDILQAASGGFSTLDLNRIIKLVGTDTGSYTIISVTSSTQIQVVREGTNALPLFVGGQNSWSISDNLKYAWEFSKTPSGSRVIQEGFRTLNDDGSLVSFSPDIVGEYLVSLTVSNGVFGSSAYEVRVSIRAILVPHARGIIPDGKWIWSYIRDVWTQVENREWFETFWSALIQIAGSELLKTYQVDFNKSIRDIQDLYQRRWMSYEPRFELTAGDLTFYLCSEAAGVDAMTQDIGNNGALLIIANDEFYIVEGSVFSDAAGKTINITYDSMDLSNVGPYSIVGLNANKTGYKITPSGLNPTVNKVIPLPAAFYFTTQSTTWSMNFQGILDYALKMSKFSDPINQLIPILEEVTGNAVAGGINVGDYIHIVSGPNTGYYRINSKSGSFFVVDHAPPSFSDPVTPSLGDVYRPAGFSMELAPKVTTNSFAVPYSTGSNFVGLAPGRLISVGGQTYTVLRVVVDLKQPTPVVIITTTTNDILFGFSGLAWRIPNTLISSSQNFEELGVSNGDLLIADIVSGETSTPVEVYGQVTGVRGNSLGFVLTDQPITTGVVPDVPDQTYVDLSQGLAIPSAVIDPFGNLSITGQASAIVAYLNSGVFHKAFCNLPLTQETVISSQGRTFRLIPKAIVRNSLIPVDTSVMSIPMLQEWIVQPEWALKNGKYYQQKSGLDFEMRGEPLTLLENTDFVVDSSTAFSGELVFDSGTDTITVEDGHFIDKGLVPGDQLVITSPITLQGEYDISRVESQDSLILAREIPAYALSTSVRAKVKLVHKRSGKFVRFVPGGFTASDPAPDRFWAEVTLFDNRDTVESNFGILVGLTRADLESVSDTISYRQAVSGLMFAYTRGAAVDEVRLGAQILLGLPFAESRGIIRSIENDYRLDALGVPILGRLLVEDIDATGASLGTLRVYTFPLDLTSSLSGVETNPSTGKTYVVGDTVELYAVLSKGVEAVDYLIRPTSVTDSVLHQLQQFHTVRLRANDNIFSMSELALVSKFLKQITPSYVKFIITSSSEFRDVVAINDDLTPRIGNNNNPIVDNASFGLSATLMLDNKTQERINLVFIDDGVFSRRTSRSDLVTVFNFATPSFTATSASGGLVTPYLGEGPVTSVGDILYIPVGPNQGRYPILSVNSDTSISVDPSSLPPKGFLSATDQKFAILRAATPYLWTELGSINVTVGDTTLSISPGLVDKGIMLGDRVSLSLGTSHSVHSVVGVGPSLAVPSLTSGAPPVTLPARAALTSGQLVVTPPVPATFSGGSAQISRWQLLESPSSVSGNLVSTGALYSSMDYKVQGLLEPGDEVQVLGGNLERLFVIDPKNLVFSRVLAAGTYSVKACKRNSGDAQVGLDQLGRMDPVDVVGAALLETHTTAATVTSTTPPVVAINEWDGAVLTLLDPVLCGIRPADLFTFLNGANSLVDVGYGPGVYPIKSITTTDVTLSVNLTSSASSGWSITRRR